MRPQTRPPLPNRRRRRTFSIAALLVLTGLSGVAAAAGSYLWNAARGQPMSAALFLGIVLITPLGTAVLIATLMRFAPDDEDDDDPQDPQSPRHRRLIG